MDISSYWLSYVQFHFSTLVEKGKVYNFYDQVEARYGSSHDITECITMEYCLNLTIVTIGVKTH